MSGLDEMLREELTHLDNQLRDLAQEQERSEANLRQLLERKEQWILRKQHVAALLGIAAEPLSNVNGLSEKTTSNGSLADAVYQLLAETGQETHYRDLVDFLAERGIQVPGKDPAINLVAHIHNDPRLIRPRRGVYALRDWYPLNMKSVGAQRKRSRRTRSGQKRVKS